MFVKPLTGKGKSAQEQRQRLGTSDTEILTVASTKNGSRKASTLNEDDLEESSEEETTQQVDIEDEPDEEFKEGALQKFISPQEVKQHISKLWKKEGDILNLIFGKFEPKGEGQPFETQSLGEQIFFID